MSSNRHSENKRKTSKTTKDKWNPCLEEYSWQTSFQGTENTQGSIASRQKQFRSSHSPLRRVGVRACVFVAFSFAYQDQYIYIYTFEKEWKISINTIEMFAILVDVEECEIVRILIYATFRSIVRAIWPLITNVLIHLPMPIVLIRIHLEFKLRSSHSFSQQFDLPI